MVDGYSRWTERMMEWLFPEVFDTTGATSAPVVGAMLINDNDSTLSWTSAVRVISGDLVLGSSSETTVGLKMTRTATAIEATSHEFISDGNTPNYEKIWGGEFTGQTAGTLITTHYAPYRRTVAHTTITSARFDFGFIDTTTPFTGGDLDVVMRVQAGGLVGINGTPTEPLHVFGDKILLVDAAANSNPSVEIQNDAGTWKFQNRGGESDNLRIAYDSNEPIIRATTTGLVGIGMIPLHELHLPDNSIISWGTGGEMQMSSTGTNFSILNTNANAAELFVKTNTNMYFDIDQLNSSSGRFFVWRHNASSTDLMLLNESGQLGVGTTPAALPILHTKDANFPFMGEATGTNVNAILVVPEVNGNYADWKSTVSTTTISSATTIAFRRDAIVQATPSTLKSSMSWYLNTGDSMVERMALQSGGALQVDSSITSSATGFIANGAGSFFTDNTSNGSLSNDAGTAFLRVNDPSGNIHLHTTVGNHYYDTDTGKDFFWREGSTVRMTLDGPTGDLAVGGTVNADEMYVSGSYHVDDASSGDAYMNDSEDCWFDPEDGTGNTHIKNGAGGGIYNDGLEFYYRTAAGATKFRVNTNGDGVFTNTVGASGYTSVSYAFELANNANPTGRGRSNLWTTWSSKRWKTDYEPITNAIDKIMQLQPILYTNINLDKEFEAKQKMVGFEAESFYEIFNELVEWEDEEKDENGLPYAEALHYDRITALNMAGIQEINTKVNNTIDLNDGKFTLFKDQIGLLETKIEELEKKIEELSN